MTTTRFFPHSTACVVHQTGQQLTDETKGVEITLHWRNGIPCSAELVSGDHYADIGLSFEGKALSDYDGVFELPSEVITMLRESGFTVSPDFVA